MKKYMTVGATILLALSLSACGTTSESSTKSKTSASETQAKEITINYLGKDYTFPNPVENIVAASLESMEDAAILGIKPVGVLEVAGAVPDYLSKELDGAALIGDKFAPNAEAILALDPDAIIGTSKWSEDVTVQMNKMATTLPYSHISTHWKDNLLALGELAGKTEEAEKVIADYDTKAKEAKEKLGESAADKNAVIIRIRAGALSIYGADLYLNPVLYEDLGMKVPDLIANTDKQTEISKETLAEVNPDIIFLQFEESENTDAPTALDDLLADPIFSSLTATKNDEVFVNVVAPLAQGGTAWSKSKFLDAAVEKLVK